MQNCKIATKNKYQFEVQDSLGTTLGTLENKDKNYFKAIIQASNAQMAINISKPTSSTIFNIMLKSSEIGCINVATNKKCNIVLNDHNKNYIFKKTGFWKTRFILALENGKEELLGILPVINWNKSNYNFTLQINEEALEKVDFLLVLIALHCTVYSLMMMNGGVN